MIQLQYVHTEKMLADRLTKPFGGVEMTDLFGVGGLVSSRVSRGAEDPNGSESLKGCVDA